MGSLEEKVEKENPDWKEWLPIYGLYQMQKDAKNGKLTIIDDANKISGYAWAYHAASIVIYHAMSMAGIISGAYYGIYILLEKL